MIIRKDGSWHISKIAKDSGTTRPTVMKYLPKETFILKKLNILKVAHMLNFFLF